jgi:carbamoyl-phosphate synthase large subunit
MGVAEGFGSAYLKAQQGEGTKLPRAGTVFISVNDQDKRGVIELARELHEMGFKIVATGGTQKRIESAGLPCEFLYKVNEGRPNVADLVKSRQIDLIINTPLCRTSFYESEWASTGEPLCKSRIVVDDQTYFGGRISSGG